MENIQLYQPQMTDSGEGGKLPNANCNQTTKWKISKYTNQNWPLQVILSHFGGKRLEKLEIGQNWLF